MLLNHSKPLTIENEATELKKKNLDQWLYLFNVSLPNASKSSQNNSSIM